MTSDAKVGLLLGLVFIFIIAFVINGLPSVRNEADNNQLTTNMVNSQNNTPGIAATERKMTRRVTNQTVRFETPLPQSKQADKPAPDIKPAPIAEPPAEVPKKEVIIRPKPALAKFYIVRDGDSLAAIAKQFYGDEQGNKMVNIQRIFDANRRYLKSADQIYVGQKLVIPPLSAAEFVPNNDESAVSILPKTAAVVKKDGFANRIYVVAEGDSLWKIAASQLGEGLRCDEIAELNTNILQDRDWLTVGMRLKIPSK